jgi:hypothetical protein
MLSGVAAVAAGGRFTCVLMTSGTIKCWGDNTRGQLGDGTTTGRATPVGVIGLSGVAAVSTGGYHTCALVGTGNKLKCWGANGRGQLGDGTTTNRSTPGDVSGLATATGVAAGGLHTCARTSQGSLKCWGRNVEGQVGDGTTVDRNTPVGVTGFDPKAGPPVGGIAELPEIEAAFLEASGSSGARPLWLAGLAGGVVASLVAVGGAGWYVRGRRIRR